MPSIVSASRHDGTICVLAKAALGVPVRYQISIESAGAARSLLRDLAERSPHLARASLADTTLSVLDAFAHIGQLLGNALGGMFLKAALGSPLGANKMGRPPGRVPCGSS